MPAKILDSAELATRLGTDPRTLRKFFRSEESPVNPVSKGNRYTVEAAKVKQLKRAFQGWAEIHTRLAS